MPYAAILPVISESIDQEDEPNIISHPDMPTSFKDLQKSWIHLKEERDTFENQVLDVPKQLHEE